MKELIRELWEDTKTMKRIYFNVLSILWFLESAYFAIWQDRPKLAIGLLCLAIFFRLWAK